MARSITGYISLIYRHDISNRYNPGKSSAIRAGSVGYTLYNGQIMSGVIDYRLAKKWVLAAMRRGVVPPTEVCDAHPELLRAARNIGVELDEPCPVCNQNSMRLVKYVFGDELRAFSGRVVYPDDWADDLASRFNEFRCYEVEVCTECRWNHLGACHLMGRRYSSQTSGNKNSRRLSGAE